MRTKENTELEERYASLTDEEIVGLYVNKESLTKKAYDFLLLDVGKRSISEESFIKITEETKKKTEISKSTKDRKKKKYTYAIVVFIFLIFTMNLLRDVSTFWAAVVNIWAFVIPVIILFFCFRK